MAILGSPWQPFRAVVRWISFMVMFWLASCQIVHTSPAFLACDSRFRYSRSQSDCEAFQPCQLLCSGSHSTASSSVFRFMSPQQPAQALLIHTAEISCTASMPDNNDSLNGLAYPKLKLPRLPRSLHQSSPRCASKLLEASNLHESTATAQPATLTTAHNINLADRKQRYPNPHHIRKSVVAYIG